MHRKSLNVCLLLICVLGSVYTYGNNLSITNTTYNSANNTLNFDISWDNCFRGPLGKPLNFVYLFVKYKNSNSSTWKTMTFPQSTHTSSSSDLWIQRSFGSKFIGGEWMAMWAIPASSFTSGSLSANCTVALSENIQLINPSFKLFGIEMIYTSNTQNDPYYVGDGISNFRFHEGDDVNSPMMVQGNIDVNVGNLASQINVTGPPLPVSTISQYYIQYPTHVMRYEITQQQYVDFLNCLPRIAQNNRTATDISGTMVTNRYVMSNTSSVSGRNGIKCDATLPNGGPINFYCDLNGNDVVNEFHDGQTLPANYLLPSDLMAYLDWAGLKPMNEMHYEYYCRGLDLPAAGEYAWGTTQFTAASVNFNPGGGPDETPSNIGSNGLFRRSSSIIRSGSTASATTNRVQAGASFFGIMDLTGNVGEMVIGSYSIEDFTLTGSGGDGALDPLGNHNQSWPDNLTIKGLAPSNSVLHSVSQRSDGANPYVSNTTRSSSHGGRGVY